MPITRQAVLNHTLMNIQVDMAGLFMECTFIKSMDGIDQGKVVMRIDGQNMLNIIGVPGNLQKTRGADITDAVYEFALASGAISGVVA